MRLEYREGGEGGVFGLRENGCCGNGKGGVGS